MVHVDALVLYRDAILRYSDEWREEALQRCPRLEEAIVLICNVSELKSASYCRDLLFTLHVKRNGIPAGIN